MRTIVIPTDLSAISMHSLNYGIDMAIALKATVRLFYVYNVPVTMAEVPVMLMSVEELEKNAETQMADLKRKVEHVVSGRIPVETETKLGDVVDEIANLCERIHPFAVVLGAQAPTGINALFGSTTLSAIRRLTTPIITVPNGKEYGTGIRKIGFACDFTDMKDTTVAPIIIECVKAFNAELHVLNVFISDSRKVRETPEFNSIKDLLKEVNPYFDFINSTDLEEGINEFADKNNLDLLIIIPRKHKLLEGIFKRSTSRSLVNRSHIPVMCIHEVN